MLDCARVAAAFGLGQLLEAAPLAQTGNGPPPPTAERYQALLSVMNSWPQLQDGLP